jgi:hypothetical protein
VIERRFALVFLIALALSAPGAIQSRLLAQSGNGALPQASDGASQSASSASQPESGGAPAASAFTDPASVDWGARYEGAKAARDPAQAAQIIELAPLPQWTKVVDNAIALLLSLCEAPNLDKPKASLSFLPATAVEAAAAAAIPQSAENAALEADAHAGNDSPADEDASAPIALLYRPDGAVSSGTIIWLSFGHSFPASTASMEFALRPPAENVSAELAWMTLVKEEKAKYVTSGMALLVGPARAPGVLELTGSVTAKDARGNAIEEVPLEIAIDVAPGDASPQRLMAWAYAGLAHRFRAQQVLLGFEKKDWLDDLMGGFLGGGEQPDNRGPDSRKHDLVAYLYGEMLRQVALGNGSDPALADAAVSLLQMLEKMELRRAQYEAAKLGKPLPQKIEGGYWWKGGATRQSFEEVGKTDATKLPPRYQ